METFPAARSERTCGHEPRRPRHQDGSEFLADLDPTMWLGRGDGEMRIAVQGQEPNRTRRPAGRREAGSAGQRR